MKRFFILLLVLASTTCFSQQINGTAEYVYKKLIEIDDSLNDGDTTILCNKITLNSEQKSIQAPTRGERTNLNDFNSIFLQKRKEREADFKN